MKTFREGCWDCFQYCVWLIFFRFHCFLFSFSFSKYLLGLETIFILLPQKMWRNLFKNKVKKIPNRPNSVLATIIYFVNFRLFILKLNMENLPMDLVVGLPKSTLSQVICQLRIGTIYHLTNIGKKISECCLTESDFAKAMATACSVAFCSLKSSFLWASLRRSKVTSSFSWSCISLISMFFSHNWHLLTCR